MIDQVLAPTLNWIVPPPHILKCTNAIFGVLEKKFLSKMQMLTIAKHYPSDPQ